METDSSKSWYDMYIPIYLCKYFQLWKKNYKSTIVKSLHLLRKYITLCFLVLRCMFSQAGHLKTHSNLVHKMFKKIKVNRTFCKNTYLWIIPPCIILPTTHLPSSLNLSVIPIGSSVFRWNWTNRTLVTFSKLLFSWPAPKKKEKYNFREIEFHKFFSSFKKTREI